MTANIFNRVMGIYNFKALILVFCVLVTIYLTISRYNGGWDDKYLFERSIQDDRTYEIRREGDISTYLIPELLDSEVQNNSIFFIDTSKIFQNFNFFNISSRQGCCIESAAKHHRNKTIYYLFTFPVIKMYNTASDSNLNVLMSLFQYENIVFRSINLKRYTENTPLEQWFKTYSASSSVFISAHTSDILRCITLWKYGGTYLDTDIFVLNNLDSLPPNHACFQQESYINNAALNADNSPIGRNIMEMYFIEILQNFDGTYWPANGPDMLTRIFNNLCNTTELGKENSSLDCGGVHALPNFVYYPVPCGEWFTMFDEDKFSEALALTSQAYAVHLWNSFSHETIVVKDGDKSAYSYFAKQHCPNVYESSVYI